MTLFLDYSQRLNLVVILENLECQGRREVWAVCDLQKLLDLTDEERTAVGYRKMMAADGREYVVWNSQNGLGHSMREFQLSEADGERLCRALDQYHVVLARDRRWWEPLVAQLPQSEQANAK